MVCIQTTVKFRLLLIRERDFLWNLCDRVPDVLDELDAFGNT
jgi:hypothetical protein